MFKFFAAAISALFVANAVVASPVSETSVEARNGPFYPIHTPTELVQVDLDALVKIAKLNLLKVDVVADVLKTFYRRDGELELEARNFPEYPWSKPPLIDIDLDLIVKLGKAKIVDVDLNLDIFKPYIKRGIPGPEPPLLFVDLALFAELAKQKLIALGFLKADVLKRDGNTYGWYYPLIDIDLDLIVKLLKTKLIVLPVDIKLLEGSIVKRNGWPGYPTPLVTIDLALIVKLIAGKIL